MNLNIEVSEIMSSDLTTVTEYTPLIQLRNLFKANRFHHLLVENNVGELLGIISSEDFSRVEHFPVPESQLVAKHIMTVNPETVNSTTSVNKVIDQFLEKRFRAIPITNENNVLIGIVSVFDIMAMLSKG